MIYEACTASKLYFKKLLIRKISYSNTQVLQRIDDVTLMCDKRIATLKKSACKPARPVQSVQPEPAVPLQPNSGAPNLLRGRKNSGQRVSDLLLFSLNSLILN